MKEIRLGSVKYAGSVAMVDDEDFEWLNQWKWNVCKTGARHIYARRNEIINGKSKNIFMHRVIMGLNDSGVFCDHIDRNTLNNQRNNLRAVTCSQNLMNKRSRVNSSSKYKGVCRIVVKRPSGSYSYWSAQAAYSGKVYFLGTFKNEEDAAVAYNIKAIELFGEFANLNIIK